MSGDSTVRVLTNALLEQQRALDDFSLNLRRVVDTSEAVRAGVLRLEMRLDAIEGRIARLEMHAKLSENPTDPGVKVEGDNGSD